VAALSLTACVFLLALWVRSYSGEDRVSGHYRGIGGRVYSSRGWIVLARSSATGFDAAKNYAWTIESSEQYWLSPDDERRHVRSPFELLGSADYAWTSAPHWLLALACGASGIFIARGRWRVSLLGLLAAMTAFAVLAAILAAL
jgi:hypothetical protein